MLSPVDLSLFPSCFDSLAWSADGELAVAAGEFVHIATAKNQERPTAAPQGKNQWHVTRIRVNYFTVAEWPLIFPQRRDDFSVAAELSTSTVIGLAWSPPGLARFRRSVLAVLTSNLVLSLWEPTGAKGQWARVGVVNHTLLASQHVPEELDGLDLRNSNIRSFAWCPPLLSPTPTSGSEEPPEAESRWGIHVLAVANDSNEVALIQVRRVVGAQALSRPYQFEKLAVHALSGTKERFAMACPESLLGAALQLKSRVTSISCGPWLPVANEHSVVSATTVIALVYGTQLRFLKTTMAMSESDPEVKVVPRYETTTEIKDHQPLAVSFAKRTSQPMKGPLKWFQTNQSPVIGLAVGQPGGLVTVLIPRTLYDGRSKTDPVKTRDVLFSSLATENDEVSKYHMEPLSAMTMIHDPENDTCSLHLGTTGGLGAVISLDQLVAGGSFEFPRWHQVKEDLREQFDLNRDLEGQTIARVWGLASHRGMSAVLLSRHPTDMVEYQVASGEATTIGFAVENPASTSAPQSLEELSLVRPDHNRWEAAIAFLLSEKTRQHEGEMANQKIIYAAACCALVGGQSEAIRGQARRTFEHLAAITGADLSEEIEGCSMKSPEISAKSTDSFRQSGAHLFEWCDVCDAGIAWNSAKEAQCTNGHLFARCRLSSLAIQEPGISKYCSVCRAEYLDEELVAASDGHQGSLFGILFETFDTCVLCDGKFQGRV
ncbi:hypothetical protein N7492_009661 [Penicillium capsulatum]|uniref:Transcription factor IIIC 90kDa subunit N-terminal domain-containing protein n=1 Tax=Penicillium capsulatum TaxID=69766 RepID=A0A9W9HUD8_9EURO|nr:hypothetical protein N7492_009661 [Penicillium capsulatum]KAJ6107048.1 hypothetical protein N7512_010565 [Penicillium capsulatum]